MISPFRIVFRIHLPVCLVWLFFVKYTSIYVKERLILPFFTNEFSGTRSRMTTSNCRNKKMQFSGKENSYSAMFSNKVL